MGHSYPTRRKTLPAVFFELESGRIPVWEWLRSLSRDERKWVGRAISVVEYGWPIGMPICRKVVNWKGLWEVRTHLADGKIARVLFCVHDGKMMILHGFIKKSNKTPLTDLELASKRMRGL